MFSIGKFSIITQLTVKSLRLYHEQGLLVPDYIDDDNGYRYYREGSVERARLIVMLRDMEFSLKEIKDILENHEEDSDVLQFLESQKYKIAKKLERYRDIDRSLELLIKNARIEKMPDQNVHTIIEKELEPILYAGHRLKGKYSDMGVAFGVVGKKAGRFINDKPIGLYYDDEYKESDADFEGGFPVKKQVTADGVDCRKLPGGKAVTLIHVGPYESIHKSYKRLYSFLDEQGYEIIRPGREVYLKGPGMIFKGNPAKYVTEIQVILK